MEEFRSMQRHTDEEMSQIDIVQTLEPEAVQVVNTLSTTELEALLAVRGRHDAWAQPAHRRASLAFDTGLSWVITMLSLLSSLLIIEHLWVGFVCSLASNTLWVGRAYGKRDWPQLLLFVLSLGLSAMGLMSWVR
jgi:uncharacterized membrane protein YdfJ with MMPL/SSD domain